MNLNKRVMVLLAISILALSIILGLYGFEFLGKSLLNAMDSQVQDYYGVGVKASVFYYVFSVVFILLILKAEKHKAACTNFIN